MYPICAACNNKKAKLFEEELLRPDEANYEYYKWFRINTSNFKLRPVKLGNANWERAEITIKRYGLNSDELIIRRKTEHEKQLRLNNENINDIPFRYMHQK